MPLTKVATNIQWLAKIHFTYKQTKIDKNTQDMPQTEINCIQIVKLTSVDFGSVWWSAMFYSFIQRIPKRKSTISNCTIRKHFLRFIDIIILGISCWVTMCLNMFSKTRRREIVEVDLRDVYTEIYQDCNKRLTAKRACRRASGAYWI